jgi:hypothetical protein
MTGQPEVIRSNQGGNRLLAPVVQKGSPAETANLLLSTPTFHFSSGQPAYVLKRLIMVSGGWSRADQGSFSAQNAQH